MCYRYIPVIIWLFVCCMHIVLLQFVWRNILWLLQHISSKKVDAGFGWRNPAPTLLVIYPIPQCNLYVYVVHIVDVWKLGPAQGLKHLWKKWSFNLVEVHRDFPKASFYIGVFFHDQVHNFSAGRKAAGFQCFGILCDCTKFFFSKHYPQGIVLFNNRDRFNMV